MEDISARTVRRLGHGILTSPGMKRERGFIQHGDVSVLEHSFMVAVLCVAIARRRSTGAAVEKKERKLTFDNLIIDMDAFVLTVKGQKIYTPPKEMELLYYLASSPNRVYTRNQLLDEVWGFDYFGDSRTVDVHIKRLREKLEGASDQWCLKTVWGVGYKFEVNQ